MPEGATATMEAIDGPTEENALDDTLNGIDAPTAIEPPEVPPRGMFAPALLVTAVLAIVVLVFLVLR